MLAIGGAQVRVDELRGIEIPICAMSANQVDCAQHLVSTFEIVVDDQVLVFEVMRHLLERLAQAASDHLVAVGGTPAQSLLERGQIRRQHEHHQRVVGPLTPADSRALSTMVDRINDYVKLSTKIQSTMPKLPAEASPQHIDKNQRELEKHMRAARASAKPGDIFTAEARPVIKRLIAAVFAEPDGKQLKDSVMDENPTEQSATKLVVNARYPDEIPISTVPPQVLAQLPKLPEELEYRFVQTNMILFDPHAHIIADFIPQAFK